MNGHFKTAGAKIAGIATDQWIVDPAPKPEPNPKPEPEPEEEPHWFGHFRIPPNARLTNIHNWNPTAPD